MASKGAHTAKSKAPDTTYEEVRYLRRLIDQKIRVRVKLMDNDAAHAGKQAQAARVEATARPIVCAVAPHGC